MITEQLQIGCQHLSRAAFIKPEAGSFVVLRCCAVVGSSLQCPGVPVRHVRWTYNLAALQEWCHCFVPALLQDRVECVLFPGPAVTLLWGSLSVTGLGALTIPAGASSHLTKQSRALNQRCKMSVAAAPPVVTLAAMFFCCWVVHFFLFFFVIASVILPTLGFVRTSNRLLCWSLGEFPLISPLKEMGKQYACFHSAPWVAAK